MARFLEKLLNLQRGDLGRGALLFTYLMLVISSYQIAKNSRDSLFLSVFSPGKLSYAIAAIAVTVWFVFAAYVVIGRRTTLRNLLIGSNVVLATGFCLFWYGAHYQPDHPWQFFVLYVWVGIFGVLAPAQVWTLANFVLTTRQAKRVFGLVAGGAITGFILGGLLTSLLAQRIGTENLLLVIAVHLMVCMALVYFIWGQRPAQAPAEEEKESVSQPQPLEGSKTLGESMKLIFSSRYLLAIAAVICISSLVTTFAGWQWVVIAKGSYPVKDDLTAFLGRFNLWVAMACLATQMLLTSRVLRRFGIGPALFVVPVALLGGEIGILALSGSLLSAIFLKGSDQLLRYSIDKSSVELLYLPIPQTVKLEAKSFIDTVVWRLGDSLAGLVLALFTDRLGWSPVKVSWVNIAFIGGWIAVAFVARREYVATLRESIRQHRLDAERSTAQVLDRSTTDILAANLSATDPKEILYALDLFRLGQQRAVHPAIRGLLQHPAPEVRQRALEVLAEAGDRAVLPQAEQLIHDSDLAVRTEALLYLTHHAHIDPLDRIQELGDFPDFSIRSAVVAFLARPGDTQNLGAARLMYDIMAREPGPEGQRTRLEAARLLSTLPDEFEDQFRVLISDEDPEVACAAIAAVAKLGKRRFVPRVLDRIADPRFTAEVSEMLVQMGPRILGTLRDHLADPGVPVEVRREIPAIFARLGTPEVVRTLEAHLFETDTVLRFRIISALNKLRQAHGDIAVESQMVESVLAAELMGHYRSYQILGTINQELASDDNVLRALNDTLAQEVERIFRLLGLLYPQFDLHSAYFGIQSQDPVVHDNALEFLDNVLKPQLRNMLVPLLDSAVPVSERVRLANQYVGREIQGREEAVAELISSDDPWLKSCGAYAIGTLGLTSLAHQLDECLTHSDPLLREAARQAKLRLAAASASD